MTTASFTRTRLLDPAAMTIAWVNAPEGLTDDLGGDGVEIRREARAVEVVEETPEVDVLLERELALNRALPEVAILGPERLRLAARVPQAVRPAVDVTEGLRDALEPDGEGPQRRRASGLDAAERARLARPERDRDEDERRDDEDADDETAAKRTRPASWNRRRDAPDCQAQRRRSRAALPGHGEPV